MKDERDQPGMGFRKLDSVQMLKEEVTRNPIPFLRSTSVVFRDIFEMADKKMKALALVEHNEAGRIKYNEDFLLIKELSMPLGPNDDLASNYSMIVIDGLHYFGLAERICQIDVDHEKYLEAICGLPLFAAIDIESMFISSVCSVDLFQIEDTLFAALDRSELIRLTPGSNSSLQCTILVDDENMEEIPSFPVIELPPVSSPSNVVRLDYPTFKLWYCSKVFAADTSQEEVWLIVPTVECLNHHLLLSSLSSLSLSLDLFS